MKRVTIHGLAVGDYPHLDAALEGARFPMVFLCEDSELTPFLHLGHDISLDALSLGLELYGIRLTEEVRAGILRDTGEDAFVYLNQEEIEVEEV